MTHWHCPACGEKYREGGLCIACFTTLVAYAKSKGKPLESDLVPRHLRGLEHLIRHNHGITERG